MPYRICKSIEVENGHMLSRHPDKVLMVTMRRNAVQ